MYTHLPKADTSGLEPPPTSQLGLPVRKILVMGLTGAGKSTFINLVAGSTLAVGTSIHSCTQIPSHVSLRLEDGTTGEVMDTPGFDDSARSEFEVLENIIHELQSWAPEGVHAVIYIHRISDYKMPGSAIRAFDMFLKMCGSTDGVMSRVAIVTNMWGNISPALGEAREDELESNDALPFKNALKLGAKFHRNNNPPQSALKIVHALVGGESSFSEPVQLAIQKELAGGIPLFQTTAGEAISFEMARKRAEHEAEVKTLSRQYEQALEDHDIEARGEIEEERKLMEKKLEELERVEARLREQMKQAAPQADRGQVEQVTYGIRRTSPDSKNSSTKQNYWIVVEFCLWLIGLFKRIMRACGHHMVSPEAQGARGETQFPRASYMRRLGFLGAQSSLLGGAGFEQNQTQSIFYPASHSKAKKSDVLVELD